ncbi:hypothetical protein [Sinomonas sp. P47F7]|uniref:hypothetical protein n=1 Tax=Sinomonas sp. P47F7 TaxID=3410987 RepID=UPI003BF54AE2
MSTTTETTQILPGTAILHRSFGAGTVKPSPTAGGVAALVEFDSRRTVMVRVDDLTPLVEPVDEHENESRAGEGPTQEGGPAMASEEDVPQVPEGFKPNYFDDDEIVDFSRVTYGEGFYVEEVVRPDGEQFLWVRPDDEHDRLSPEQARALAKTLTEILPPAPEA